MTPSRPRAFSITVLLLGAAALGMAGCTSGDKSPDAVKSLSDLPNKDRSMLKVGDASRQAGDCAAALRFYKLVVDKEESPADLVGARLGSADCELSLNALPQAEHDFTEAMKLAPNDPAPLIGLGRLYLVEHEPGKAASYFDLAIKKGATSAFVWNDKGVAYDQLRRHKEAQQAYREGLTSYPNDGPLRNNLALSLAMSRDFREAETLLRTLASEPSATARTRQNLALVLGLEGDTAGARRVSAGDLDGAALDNNGRFYDYARALITGGPLPSPSASNAAPAEDTTEPLARATRGPSQAAADAPLLSPVLVENRPLASERQPVLKFRRAADSEMFEPPPPAAIAQTEMSEPKQTAEADPAPGAPTHAPTPLITAAPQAVAATAGPVASSENQ